MEYREGKTDPTQASLKIKTPILAIELSNARMPPTSGELPMRKTQVSVPFFSYHVHFALNSSTLLGDSMLL
jgi:hypothetical protein